MKEVTDFLLGMVVGGMVVGSSVHRTLSVHNGKVAGALNGSVQNSIAYFFSVNWIAKDNYVAYLGTAVGSTLVVLWMTMRNRKYSNKGEIIEDRD